MRVKELLLTALSRANHIEEGTPADARELNKARNHFNSALSAYSDSNLITAFQKVVDVKEIRLGLSIDTHDFETKGNHAIKFLKGGDKVKVSIRFRGREFGHPEIGKDIMDRFAEYCSEVASVEKPAKMEGRNMLMFLAPKPVK